MFRKRTLIIVVCLLGALGAGWYFFGRDTEEEIATETVRRTTIVETVSVTGKLVPVEYADVSFRALGQVKEIFVKEGEEVEAGDVLAVLDTAVLQAQLRDTRTALSKAEESERLARRDWDSLKPEERQVARLTTEQAREDVRIVEAQMRDYRLLAPLSGVVSQVDVRSGEVVTAGRIIARISGKSDLLLEARVPESDITKIALGMRAALDFDALPSGEVLEAEVSEIDQSATVIQDVVSYIVKFRLVSGDARLKEGMTADIDVETKKSENVLVIPFRSLTKEGDNFYAQKMRADGTLERVQVQVGIEGDNATIEVTSGLQEGDKVALGSNQKK